MNILKPFLSTLSALVIAICGMQWFFSSVFDPTTILDYYGCFGGIGIVTLDNARLLIACSSAMGIVLLAVCSADCLVNSVLRCFPQKGTLASD